MMSVLWCLLLTRSYKTFDILIARWTSFKCHHLVSSSISSSRSFCDCSRYLAWWKVSKIPSPGGSREKADAQNCFQDWHKLHSTNSTNSVGKIHAKTPAWINFWVQNSSSSFISCALPCTSLKENLGDFSCCTMKQSTIETLTTPCETSLEKNGNHRVQHGSMAQRPCLTLSTALADFVCLSLPGLFDLNKSPCGEIQPLHV